MNFFAIAIRILFLISTLLFFINFFIWIAALLQNYVSLPAIKNFFKMTEYINEKIYYKLLWTGCYAGLIGFFSLLIYGLSFLFKQHNEVEIKYVFISILYGIVWFVFVFGRLQ